MDKLRFDFTFHHLKFIQDFTGQQNLLLWVFHVDKIPPHVGVSQEGVFFSLKSNGRDKLPVNNVVQTIEKKNIKCIVLNVNYRYDLGRIRQVYNEYERAISVQISCLVPIKDLLNIPDNVCKLSDLLNFLNDNKLLNGYHSFNVTNDELGILKYELADIEKRLNRLHSYG